MGTMVGYYVPFNPRMWVKNTTYAQNDYVLKYDPTDGNLYVFYASQGGTFGTTEPEWIRDTPIDDGTV